jgi:hypothetical protein
MLKYLTEVTYNNMKHKSNKDRQVVKNQIMGTVSTLTGFHKVSLKLIWEGIMTLKQCIIKYKMGLILYALKK